MVDYIATDAHRPEHLEKMKDLTIPKKLITPLELICEGQRLF
jgi:hypothetical protein